MSLTDEQKQLIETLGRGGCTSKQIALLTNLTYQAVYSHLCRRGIAITRHGEMLPHAERNKKMVAMYMEGQTLEQIGQQFDITRERVRQILNIQGCSRRTSKTRTFRAPKFKPTPTDKYWACVDKGPGHGPWGDCWKWTGVGNGVDQKYGRVRFRGAMRSVRQVAFFLEHRRWSEAERLGNTCRYEKCVHPKHLVEGTFVQFFCERSPIYRRNKRIQEARNGNNVE